MSDKDVGQIQNSGDASQPKFEQPWTPQMMTPKLDRSDPNKQKSEDQVKKHYGTLELTDDENTSHENTSQSRKFKVEASVRVELPAQQSSSYPSEYDNKPSRIQHHDRLHMGTADGADNSYKAHAQSNREQYLVGQTTIPAIHGHHSERLSTTLPAANYQEGERFNQVLNIPAEHGKSNYYNGLANAHYEHGHLYGVPAHMERNPKTGLTFMVDHLQNEIDIPLHRK